MKVTFECTLFVKRDAWKFLHSAQPRREVKKENFQGTSSSACWGLGQSEGRCELGCSVSRASGALRTLSIWELCGREGLEDMHQNPAQGKGPEIIMDRLPFPEKEWLWFLIRAKYTLIS